MILVDFAVLSGRPDAAFLKTLARLRSLRAENNNLDVIDSALDHLALCCYLFDEALELAQQCEEGMDALVSCCRWVGKRKCQVIACGRYCNLCTCVCNWLANVWMR